MLAALRRFWHETVYLNEVMLAGPWEREGEMRWRRGPAGEWTLVGATAPSRPVERPTPVGGEGVIPRRAPSSC